MKVVFTATEAEPFVKVGGLGDIAGTLPKAIQSQGIDIRIFIPFYNCIHLKNYKFSLPVMSKKIDFDHGVESFDLIQSTLPDSDVPIYFIKNDRYFSLSDEVYVRHTTPVEEAKRFAFFSKAVLESLKEIDFQPDIIHTNDWHTSFIPIFIHTYYKDDIFFQEAKNLLTIHNLAYQGVSPASILKNLDLENFHLMTIDILEYYGEVNWLKGGIALADMVNTVSERYSLEIQFQEFGATLHDFLKTKSHKLAGILNGVDYHLWNPAWDHQIPYQYSAENLDGKKLCKRHMQKELGLEIDETIPLICFISRLVDQKGVDLIATIVEDLELQGVQFVLLGSGDPYYENVFKEAANKYKNFKAFIGFNAHIAQTVYAGSDMILMPSRFEPCGLSQIIALRYGTVPVVRDIGGLHDTIIDVHHNDQLGYGFKFHDYSKRGLLTTLSYALEMYKNKDLWHKIMMRGMQQDFSIQKTAEHYVSLYEQIKLMP